MSPSDRERALLNTIGIVVVWLTEIAWLVTVDHYHLPTEVAAVGLGLLFLLWLQARKV